MKYEGSGRMLRQLLDLTVCPFHLAITLTSTIWVYIRKSHRNMTALIHCDITTTHKHV